MAKPKGKVEYYIKRRVSGKIIGTYQTSEQASAAIDKLGKDIRQDYGVFYSPAAVAKYKQKNRDIIARKVGVF